MSSSTGYHEFPKFSNESSRTVDYTSDEEIMLGDYSCEALRVWHFNPRSKCFSDLPAAPNLKYLEVNFSNCTNLIGLEKYPHLERLDLNYCTKLESLDGIENLSKGIFCLWIDHSQKLSNHSDVVALPNLRTLAMHSCGTIRSIEFLDDMKKLTMFAFLNTNIADGDMTPLIRHTPKFEFVSFSNKHHFSHKLKEMYKILDIQV